MAYEPRLLRHMSRFYWGWGWSSIYWKKKDPAVQSILGPAFSRNVSGIFVVQILEDFVGDFTGGFFGALSHRNEEKKYGGPKIESEKIRSAKVVDIKNLLHIMNWISHVDLLLRLTAGIVFREHCSEKRTHWVLQQARWVFARKATRWDRFGAQNEGREELTELLPRSSVSTEKLTELGVWNRALWNRMRAVSDLLPTPSLRMQFSWVLQTFYPSKEKPECSKGGGRSKVTTEQQLFNTLDGPNRQLPIASVQRTRPALAGLSAVPRGTNTTPMNANRAIRIAAQRTQGLWGPNPVFWVFWGRKKPINRKHINIFLTALVGQSSQRQIPTRPRDKWDKMEIFTVELNRKRPVCPRDASQFVPGRGPVCPRDGSCLSRTLSRPKCLCFFFSCPRLVEDILRGLQGHWGEISRSCPQHFSEGAFYVRISRTQLVWGNFLEVCFRTPEVHMVLLCFYFDHLGTHLRTLRGSRYPKSLRALWLQPQGLGTPAHGHEVQVPLPST